MKLKNKHNKLLQEIIYKEIDKNKKIADSIMKSKNTNIEEYEIVIDKIETLRYITESIKKDERDV